MKIYNKAVGGNSSLLLNVCPSKNGIVEEDDVIRLKEMGDAIKAQYQNQIKMSSVKIGGVSNKTELDAETMKNLLDNNRESYEFKEEDYIIDLNFESAQKVTRIDLRENMAFSHRVELYDVYVKNGDGRELISNEGNIGNRRSIILDPKKAPTTTAVRIVIKQARKAPVLRFIGIYA